jgi:superfamily II RNA helicase
MSLKYKEFILDPFQEESIAAIDRGHSVVVSAATGTGKTLIADYIIDKAVKEGWHVIYTAPIKALSNQKFRDFRAQYGDKIGLLTGDIVVNPDAPIRIMTTEIYRNMLLDKEPLDRLKYVIFDEIHFINDIERGTVWEESIIFSHDHVRFLCLSATIPNYRQFADWIQSIKKHEVETIHYGKRAVPLSHHVFDTKLGLTDPESMGRDVKSDSFDKYRRRSRGRRGRRGPKRYDIKAPDHRDLIRELQQRDWLPSIFFAFSRRATFTYAEECAKKFDFTSKKEKAQIIETVNRMLKPEIKHMETVKLLKQLLSRGVGVHNAGMLPNLKEIVEHLFGEGLIRVLYATETFAVGINMPARTVCFASLQKYDGRSFRHLSTKEYFQLAGRAGRRGIDMVGHAITMLDRFKLDMDAVMAVMDRDVEPIRSQFKLSYNTVLNLIKNHNDAERQKILQSNFGYFVKQQSAMQSRIMTSFANYRRRLEQLDFLSGDRLTWKGEFASHIYVHEIAISELIFSGILKEMNDKDFMLTLLSLVYDKRPADHFVIKGANVGRLIALLSRNKEIRKAVNFVDIKRLHHLCSIWMDGGSFDDLLNVCNLAEGDIIRLFRQLLDMLSQIKHALYLINHDESLIQRIKNCERLIDRDLIAVDF